MNSGKGICNASSTMRGIAPAMIACWNRRRLGTVPSNDQCEFSLVHCLTELHHFTLRRHCTETTSHLFSFVERILSMWNLIEGPADPRAVEAAAKRMAMFCPREVHRDRPACARRLQP